MKIMLHKGPEVTLDLPPFCKEDIVHFGKIENGQDKFEWEIFYKDDGEYFVLNIDFKEGSWFAQESWTFHIYPPCKTPRVESFYFMSDSAAIWSFKKVANTEFDYSNIIF